jgi:hypothetical protein
VGTTFTPVHKCAIYRNYVTAYIANPNIPPLTGWHYPVARMWDLRITHERPCRLDGYNASRCPHNNTPHAIVPGTDSF